MLLRKMLLALKDESDGKPGTAPAGAKFVAYVVLGNHDARGIEASAQRSVSAPHNAERLRDERAM